MLTLLVCGGLAWGRVRASDLRRTAVVEAVQRARPSVVNIQGRKTVRSESSDASGSDPFRQVNGMGTGIVIDPRGYILTNFHVVENVELIQVTLADKREHVATFISHDPVSDLAVIKITTDGAMPMIDFGVSSDLMPGEPVIAVGNAFGYEHTVTCGIISALHREVQVSASQKYRDLIQTDASINPGNSGGPLLNIDGQMVGINVAVRVGAQGIGFAIPVDETLEIASQLLSAERLEEFSHGVIGETRNEDTRRSFVITGLRQNSPAEQCGLMAGDIVTGVDNSPVARRLDFERALLGRSPDQPVGLTVQRNGQLRTLNLTLAAAKPASEFDQLTWRVLGLRLGTLGADEFRESNSRYRGGMRILSVRADSPAAQQGIRSGDVLVGMHVWETISSENVRYILNHGDLDRYQPIKFYVLRGRETLYGHLQLDRTEILQAARGGRSRS